MNQPNKGGPAAPPHRQAPPPPRESDPEDRRSDYLMQLEGGTSRPQPGPRKPQPVSYRESAVALLALGTWLVVFTAGIIVGTKDYRDDLTRPLGVGFWQGLSQWFVVITCYTITNVAILSALSSLLGGIARHARIGGGDDGGADFNPRSRELLSAVMRGFFTYLLVASGLILITTQAITDANREQYIRLAAMTSVLCFVMGYDRLLFKRLLGLVHSSVKLPGGTEAVTPPRPPAEQGKAEAEARAAWPQKG